MRGAGWGGEVGVPFFFSFSTHPPPSLPFLPSYQGKRALSFVLKNQGLIDKTLLFNVELLRVTKK